MSSFREGLLELLHDAESHASTTAEEAVAYHEYDAAVSMRFQIKWAPFQFFLERYRKPQQQQQRTPNGTGQHPTATDTTTPDDNTQGRGEQGGAQGEVAAPPARQRLPIPRLYTGTFREYRLLVTLVRRGADVFIAAYVENTLVGEGQWQALTYFRFEIPGQPTRPEGFASFAGRFVFSADSQRDRGCPYIINTDELFLCRPGGGEAVRAADTSSLEGGEFFTVVVTVRNGTLAQQRSPRPQPLPTPTPATPSDDASHSDAPTSPQASCAGAGASPSPGASPVAGAAAAAQQGVGDGGDDGGVAALCAATGLVPLGPSGSDSGGSSGGGGGCPAPRAVFAGLHNQGATCYLNSLLQTLFHLKEFRRASYRLIEEGARAPQDPQPPRGGGGGDSQAVVEEDECAAFTALFRDCNSGDKTDVALQLALLFVELQSERTSGAPVRTTALTDAFGWTKATVFEQHDVQELARILIDNLERKMKGTPDAHTMQALLMGESRKVVTCMGQDRATTEPYYDLQLRVKGFASLKESLAAELQVEHLTGKNQYHYVDPETGVDTMADAQIGTEFLSFPPVLMVHLRRFEYSVEKGGFVKINDRFSFPRDLDLSDLVRTISGPKGGSRGKGRRRRGQRRSGTRANGVPNGHSSCSEAEGVPSCTPNGSNGHSAARHPHTADAAPTPDADAEEEAADTAQPGPGNGTPHLSCAEPRPSPPEALTEALHAAGSSNGGKPGETADEEEEEEEEEVEEEEEEESEEGNGATGALAGDACNDYVLHSVLVHSGGTGSGHYYAYIAPESGADWFKFNDTRVSPSHDTEVLQDNWGGVPPRERFWLQYSHAQSNAYMLVYIRKSLWEAVCQGPCEPPARLKRYLSSTKLAHISVFTEAHIAAHVNAGGGQVDLLPTPASGIQLTISTSATWGELLSAVSRAAGCPLEGLRLWITSHWHRERQRGFGRPHLCVSDFGMYVGKSVVRIQPGERLPQLPASSAASPIAFFVSHHIRPTPQSRIVFVKRFKQYEGRGSIAYVGSIVCPNRGSVKSFLNQICAYFSLSTKKPKLWVERGADPSNPCGSPDLALVGDLKLECDSKDGTVLLLEDADPPAVASRKVRQELGGLLSTPDEKTLHLADSLLGRVGLDRWNIADHMSSLLPRPAGQKLPVDPAALEKAAQVVLHPTVQLSCRINTVSAEDYFLQILSAYPVSLKQIGEDGRAVRDAPSLRILAQTGWTSVDAARAAAPRVSIPAKNLRFWTVQDGKRHTLWSSKQTGPAQTLGQLLGITPLIGAWYVRSARGESLPEKTLFWETVQPPSPTECGGGGRGKDTLVDAVIVLFNEHNRPVERSVVPFPRMQTVSNLLERYRIQRGLPEGQDMWLLVVNGARLDRVFSHTAASCVTDEMLCCELRVILGPRGGDPHHAPPGGGSFSGQNNTSSSSASAASSASLPLPLDTPTCPTLAATTGGTGGSASSRGQHREGRSRAILVGVMHASYGNHVLPLRQDGPQVSSAGIVGGSGGGVGGGSGGGGGGSIVSPHSVRSLHLLGAPHLLTVSDGDTPEDVVEKASQTHGFPTQQNCGNCKVCALTGTGGSTGIGALDVLKPGAPAFDRLLRSCYSAGGASKRIPSLSASLSSPGSVISPLSGGGGAGGGGQSCEVMSPPIIPRIVILHNYPQCNATAVKIHN